MLPALLLALGLVELLFPKQVVAAVTRIAYDIDGDVQPKPWLYTAARVEGATLVLLALWKLSRSSKADAEAEASD